MNCTSLQSITLPDSITAIGNYAFSGCANLKSLLIPDNVTSIGSGIVSGCMNLTEIRLPLSVTEIRSGAFSDSEKMQRILVSSSHPTLTSIDGVLYDKKMTRVICFPAGKTGVFTVPEGVKAIPVSSFKGSKHITKVIVPGSVKTIGVSAFNGCTSLKEVAIADGVQTLCAFSFSDCTALTDVVLPSSVKRIGYGVFQNCKSLKRIILPEGLTDAEQNLFKGCSSLSYVQLPESIKVIHSMTIADCKALKSIYIPSKVFIISASSFDGCTGLTLIGPKGGRAEIFSRNRFPFSAVERHITNTSTLSVNSLFSGGSVKVNCQATNGKSPAFAVYYKQLKQNGWTVVQDYSTNKTVTITPRTITDYAVKVKARDADGTVSEKYLHFSVIKKLVNQSEISAAEIRLGSSVDVTCKASFGKAPYSYAVYYKQETQEKWTRLQDYSTRNVVKVTPKAAKKYRIRVEVKDALGSTAEKELSVNVLEDFVNCSSLQKSEAYVKTDVRVTLVSVRGKGSVQYALYLKKASETKWKCLQNYSNQSYTYVNIASAGDYTVRVKAKDGSGRIAVKDLTLTILPLPFENCSSIRTPQIICGETAVVDCNAVGDESSMPYQFAVFYRRQGNTSWTCIQSYKANQTVTFSPTESGDYVVRVKCKDARNLVSDKDLYLAVTR